MERLGELFAILPAEWYRVSKPEAHCFVFCDYNRFTFLVSAMEKAGWDVWPRPLIWYKGNTGAYPHAERGFRYTYECILFANKGSRPTQGLHHDVICIDQIQNQDHPAGKPPRLYAELLKRSVLPGDTVLDCFAGGGTIFPAATATNCIATGIELSEKYHAIAKLRMNETIGD
jgi:site-specific DNA-methyltransferase (adenine-specific)